MILQTTHNSWIRRCAPEERNTNVTRGPQGNNKKEGNRVTWELAEEKTVWSVGAVRGADMSPVGFHTVIRHILHNILQQ